jgi:hypothetical protein
MIDPDRSIRLSKFLNWKMADPASHRTYPVDSPEPYACDACDIEAVGVRHRVEEIDFDLCPSCRAMYDAEKVAAEAAGVARVEEGSALTLLYVEDDGSSEYYKCCVLALQPLLVTVRYDVDGSVETFRREELPRRLKVTAGRTRSRVTKRRRVFDPMEEQSRHAARMRAARGAKRSAAERKRKEAVRRARAAAFEGGAQSSTSDRRPTPAIPAASGSKLGRESPNNCVSPKALTGTAALEVVSGVVDVSMVDKPAVVDSTTPGSAAPRPVLGEARPPSSSLFPSPAKIVHDWTTEFHLTQIIQAAAIVREKGLPVERTARAFCIPVETLLSELSRSNSPETQTTGSSGICSYLPSPLLDTRDAQSRQPCASCNSGPREQPDDIRALLSTLESRLRAAERIVY